MTKKDYKMIARVIVRYREDMISKFSLVKELADAMGAGNPNFDRDKFFHACYPEATNLDGKALHFRAYCPEAETEPG